MSLKIDDSVFGETEKILSRIKVPRNRYIDEALGFYNRIKKCQILEHTLKIGSDLVKEESLNAL